MKIYYFDKSNIRHDEILVGYFEKGYSGKVYVEINSIDKDGKLDLIVYKK